MREADGIPIKRLNSANSKRWERRDTFSGQASVHTRFAVRSGDRKSKVSSNAEESVIEEGGCGRNGPLLDAVILYVEEVEVFVGLDSGAQSVIRSISTGWRGHCPQCVI